MHDLYSLRVLTIEYLTVPQVKEKKKYIHIFILRIIKESP